MYVTIQSQKKTWQGYALWNCVCGMCWCCCHIKICYYGCCHGDTSLNDNNNDTLMFMFNVLIVFVMVVVI